MTLIHKQEIEKNMMISVKGQRRELIRKHTAITGDVAERETS